MAQRRSLGVIAGDGREVDVAGAVLLVADVPFFLENPQKGTHRRVAGTVEHPLVDLRRRGIALVLLATAQVQQGEIEQSCRTGTRALGSRFVMNAAMFI